MNVLILDEVFYPHGGGGGFATYLYSNLLSDAGHNIVVITNKFKNQPNFSKRGNLQVHRLPLFKGSSYNKFSILQKFDILSSAFFIRMIKWADVVYIPRFWYSAIPIAKLHKKPVVTHLHGYIPICPMAANYNVTTGSVCTHTGLRCSPKCIFLAEKYSGRTTSESIASMVLNFTFGNIFYKSILLSDALICVSHAQQDILCKNFPLLSSKICVINNPLPDLSYVDLNGDDFAYFGGSTEVKGFNVLYEAFKKTNQKLVLNATNFPIAFPITNRLNTESLIVKYGPVKGIQMSDIYRTSRAVIVPSICQEPAPYVVYEALLRGRVVICSNIGGMPEQIDGFPGGFLFTPSASEHLSLLLDYVAGMSRGEVEDLGLKNRLYLLNKNQNFKSLASLVTLMNRLL